MGKGPYLSGVDKDRGATHQGEKRKRPEPAGQDRGNVLVHSTPQSGGGTRAASKGQENMFETVGIIKPEAFAKARAAEILAVSALIPPLANSSGARGGDYPAETADGKLGASRQRMALRRRAASYRPYKFSLAVRQRLYSKRARKDPGASHPIGVPVLCRARRRSVRLLADRQLQGRSARPGDEQSDHALKATGVSWLATHLWHSKRMAMGDFFGVRVAISRADAGARAATRWSRTACTLHDASYLVPLVLRAPRAVVRAVLSALLAPRSPALSRDCREGLVETEVVLHSLDAYPQGAVAPVRVAWRPPDDGAKTSSEVWLWAHPAAASDVEGALRESAARAKGVLPQRGQAARFELRGPEAAQVLSAVLEGAGGVGADMVRRGTRTGAILSRVVQDPRAAARQRTHEGGGLAAELREKPWLAAGDWRSGRIECSAMDQWCPTAGKWDEVCGGQRVQVTSDAEVNQRNRDGLLFPRQGGPSGTDAGPCVTLVAVGGVRCRSRSTGGGGELVGWDVVVRWEWARVIWLALVRAGGRAIGQRERAAVESALKRPEFPAHFPDTPAFARWAAAERDAQAARVAALPPRMRGPRRPEGRCDGSVVTAETLQTLFWGGSCERGDGELRGDRPLWVARSRTGDGAVCGEGGLVLVQLKVQGKGRLRGHVPLTLPDGSPPEPVGFVLARVATDGSAWGVLAARAMRGHESGCALLTASGGGARRVRVWAVACYNC